MTPEDLPVCLGCIVERLTALGGAHAVAKAILYALPGGADPAAFGRALADAELILRQPEPGQRAH